jgi:hypothetical protein
MVIQKTAKFFSGKIVKIAKNCGHHADLKAEQKKCEKYLVDPPLSVVVLASKLRHNFYENVDFSAFQVVARVARFFLTQYTKTGIYIPNYH